MFQTSQAIVFLDFLATIYRIPVKSQEHWAAPVVLSFTFRVFAKMVYPVATRRIIFAVG
jgi:hypothetical protein